VEGRAPALLAVIAKYLEQLRVAEGRQQALETRPGLSGATGRGHDGQSEHETGKQAAPLV
jgi:hypothetical protein